MAAVSLQPHLPQRAAPLALEGLLQRLPAPATVPRPKVPDKSAALWCSAALRRHTW